MSSRTGNPLTCWAVTGGEAGCISQAKGLAQAITSSFELKTVSRLSGLWRLLPGHFAGRLRAAETLAGPDMRPPWPDLLVTCSKHAVPAAIALKRAAGGRMFTVHIQDPRVPSRYFDMVVPPAHDGLAGTNVVTSAGALHHVTREALADGAARFGERFADLPRPLIAALFGGKSRAYDLTPERTRELAEQLKALTAKDNAGLIVSISRRTGPECTAILREVLAGTRAVLWDGTGENPYFGMLALADWIVVTEDSASMVSEACFTGKPVYVAKLTGHSKRFERMHQSFRDAGFTRPFAGTLETWTYQPLDEATRIAAIVREGLQRYRNRIQAREG